MKKENNHTLKKIIVLMLSLFTMIGLLFIAGRANPIIELEDEGLEQAVREKLDRPTGPIYETDLRSIHELDASGREIESLIGLERFTQLVELNLANNPLTDLSPLANLTRLNVLNLANNGLTHLEEVNFDEITHLTLLELDLRENQIEDLSPLSHFNQLEELVLRNNGIVKLEEVNFERITHLPLKKLDLRGNGTDEELLSDVHLLKDIRTIEELDLRDNYIKDLAPLAYLNNLEDLDLRNNRIIDLEEVNFDKITHLPLKVLNLRHNVAMGKRLSDIRLLENFTLLEELSLRDNHIEELSVLTHLTNLEVLDIRENKFTDIEVLAELTELKELNLRDNKIDTIEPITDLKNLTYLNIHSNDQIASLKPIANLTNLETLIIRGVPIGDELYIFDNLTNLQRLNALDTGIEKQDTHALITSLRAAGALQDEVRPVTLLHTVEPPSFSDEGGFYEEEFTLELDSNVENGNIHYTLDGSEPTMESTQYTKKDPISLELQNEDEPVVVRAKVFTSDHNISETITQTYFVHEDIQNRHSLPVISIATDKENLFDEDIGIYTPKNANNRGSDWERPVHIEYFEKNGQRGFKQNAGVRLHGGQSRIYAQKSFRLYADHGHDTTDEFNYELFEGLRKKDTNEMKTTFKRLLLRNSGNDWRSTMFRDAMLQSLVEPLGTMDTQAYQPAAVFVNGEYWGIHNLRERYDEYYLAETYNLPPDKVTILEGNGKLDTGNPGEEDHYKEMIRFIEENPLETPENYETVQTMMDTENFRDYLIAQTYFGNIDWPHGNIKYWRNNTGDYLEDAPYGHDGRWRWMLYDTDFGFGRHAEVEDSRGNLGDHTHNTIDWVMTELDAKRGEEHWPNFLIRSLMQNERFRNEFLARYSDLLNSYFEPYVAIEKIDTMQTTIADEMPKHIERWQAIHSMNAWQNNVEVMRTFAKKRPAYIRTYLMDAFNIEGTVNLTIAKNPFEQGHVQINGLEINEELPGVQANEDWTGEYFREIPITLTAIAEPGYTFSHWEGIAGTPTDESVELVPEQDSQIKAIFYKK